MVESSSLVVSHCAVLCSAGNTETLLQNLHQEPEEVLTKSNQWLKDKSGYFAMVDLPDHMDTDRVSKSNQLLEQVLDEIEPAITELKLRVDSRKIAVIIATTTTGMQNVEKAKSCSEVNYSEDQEMSACSVYVANYCGIDGPVIAVSTACTSGAKVFGLAQKLINGGWCDAAIVGASESLCRMTCQGFDVLESYSSGISRPFQVGRDGINIGEGAAAFIVEKGEQGIRLAGYGESSDAYHESAPDPAGVGAEKAIKTALKAAQIDASQIDYINLHGTGTRLNDYMESNVINRLFGQAVKASSTKPLTGHTLGASGAIEAAILWLLLNADQPVSLPPQKTLAEWDSELPMLDYVGLHAEAKTKVTRALSTSFAFGGHNTALILERIRVK